MGSPFIGVDVAGVQKWKGQLDSAHERVIAALRHYRTVAHQNNEVAHGSHFQSINAQCEETTNEHIAEHTELHAQYTELSNGLVQAVIDIAGD